MPVKPNASTAGNPEKLSTILGIVWTCIAAWLVLAVFRAFIVSDVSDKNLPTALWSGLGASYHDLLLSMVVAMLFAVLVAACWSQRWLVAMLRCLFWATIAIVVIWGFANIKLTRMLGEPFTYQWLLYADYLQNTDAKAAMGDALSIGDVMLVGGSILAILVVGYILGRVFTRLVHGMRPVLLISLAFIVFGAVLFLTRHDALAKQFPPTKTANPIVYFASSLIDGEAPILFTMQPRANADEFRPAGDRPANKSTFQRTTRTPIENVLIFVMESTPAEYLQNYGGKYPVTPNILKYAGSAMRFDNIYAHAPATNYSLFSLFTSVYPDISYHSMSTLHPDLPLTAITNVFAQRGARTSFIWSADTRFQTFDRFLENKQIDLIKDYRDIRCNQPVFALSTEKYQNMDLAHDFCTANEQIDFIAAKPDVPFFSIMQTGMTHFPYEMKETPVHYVDDEKRNAYLNTLRIGDQAFGMVMKALEDAGKLDTTLVVLLGDHGEAFGQHGNYVHASALYEENVHIPLMFINRKLFSGGSSGTVGGIVDIAPTVLDIMGIPEPEGWQGRSLFSPDRSGRAYFFSPWNGYQFGYREGSRKVLYNASTGQGEVYDLAKDPLERRNLIAEGPDLQQQIDPIAAWVQYQHKLIADKVAAASTNAGACGLNTIAFDAAGTRFKGPPRVDVLVDNALVGSLEVEGIDSKASETEAILAELSQASKQVHSYSLRFPDIADAKKIELRFANDLWSGESNGGDRNVHLANVTANGARLSHSRYSIFKPEAGMVSDTGADLYTNGSVVIHGPFAAGCS